MNAAEKRIREAFAVKCFPLTDDDLALWESLEDESDAVGDYPPGRSGWLDRLTRDVMPDIDGTIRFVDEIMKLIVLHRHRNFLTVTTEIGHSHGRDVLPGDRADLARRLDGTGAVYQSHRVSVTVHFGAHRGGSKTVEFIRFGRDRDPEGPEYYHWKLRFTDGCRTWTDDCPGNRDVAMRAAFVIPIMLRSHRHAA